MTLLCTVAVLAALNASGLMRSPNQINQRDGISQEKLSHSALEGLSDEERAVRWTEHERVGRDLVGLLGFEFGKPLADYAFALDPVQPDDPAHPVYNLAAPAFGFVRFRPILVLGRLCGILLTRPIGPCEEEEDWQAAFAAANAEVTTNLVATLSLSTNSLSCAANDVPHVWRISLERWSRTQVLRIGDGELAAQLIREEKERAEAEGRDRIKRLMHHEETVPPVEKGTPE